MSEASLGGACIVYYHGNAWNGVPARQRYLMEAMSEHIDVIYIEETRQKYFQVTYEKIGDNLTIVRGLAPVLVKFERRRWSALMYLFCRFHLGWIRRKYKTIIFWTAENWLRPHRFIDHDFLIFDCIDPCFSEESSVVNEFDRREREILAKADLIFASAELLLEHCRQFHNDVVLLNNACQPDDYDEVKVVKAARPGWWPSGERPVMAYLGTMDQRFDFDTARRACREHPTIDFIFAGQLIPEAHAEGISLSEFTNARLPGRISVEEGRYLLARCTAGMIPFRSGVMNDAINPVKMYAYAILGKPMIGFASREHLLRDSVVLIARTAEEFSAKVPIAIELADSPAYCEELRRFGRANTWKHRAAAAVQEICRILNARAKQIETLQL